MIKVIILLTVLFSFSTVYAQKDLIDRIEKLAVETDSLKSSIKAKTDTIGRLNAENSMMEDTIEILKSDLAKLEEFRIGKKKMDTILVQKSDSIALLKAAILEKDKQFKVDIQKVEQKEREKCEADKGEILATIANSYKNKTFDELIKSSTKASVQRELQLFQNRTEIKQILSDLERYFIAKELLELKVDIIQVKNIQYQLLQIKTESVLLRLLKEIVDNYQAFTDGLKETIGKIMTLDRNEEVYGMSKEIQKKKFDKILAEISSYIFNYDFIFSDYPYLSDVLLEIIKRKQPNPDADIADLLKKL